MVLKNDDKFYKKGQTGFFFLFMVGVTLFAIGFNLISALVKNNNQVMDNLGCNNSSIDTSKKITCTTIDLIAPWVGGLIFGLAGMVLISKLTGV